MARSAGEVHSIRLPSGMAADLYKLTGQRVSTFCRQQVTAAIRLEKLKRARADAEDEEAQAA